MVGAPVAPESKQLVEVKTVSSIVQVSELYKFVRRDFQGCVASASMQELASCDDVPFINIDFKDFSSSVLQGIVNKIQDVAWATEFELIPDRTLTEVKSKFDIFNLHCDLATGNVFTSLDIAADKMTLEDDEEDDFLRLHFAGQATTVKNEKGSHTVAVIRVESEGSAVLTLPIYIDQGYFSQLTTDNKASCAVMAWMVRKVSGKGQGKGKAFSRSRVTLASLPVIFRSLHPPEARARGGEAL